MNHRLLGPFIVFAALTLPGCSLLQDPAMFPFIDDAGVGSDTGLGVCELATDCPARAAAVLDCVAGVCDIASCQAGFADCDGSLESGCEAELATDPNHCGRCANACDLANAITSCNAGACEIDLCIGGFEDCNVNRSDGCETDLRSPSSCGTCSLVCTVPAILCDTTQSPSMCVESCSGDAVLCGGSCIDLSRDALHCTACDLACPVPDNSAPTCADGCGFACVGTFADCNTDEADGCEVDLSDDSMNCGSCDRVCSGLDASWICATSDCAIDTCDPGFADCNTDPTDGCEVELAIDPMHCGGCGSPCGGTCVNGVCDPVVHVTGERQHTCAINASGELFCWGYNNLGALGMGDVTPQFAPTQVFLEGSALLVRDVAVGELSSCVASNTGTLLCAGRNGYFELGNGSAANLSVFTPVTSADSSFASRNFVSVAAGQSFHCGLDDSGGVWCWGRNQFGQVGTGDTANVSQATRVSTLSGPARAVGLGVVTSCALLMDETVSCWGRNNAGQVGALAGTTTVVTPTDVGLGEVISLGVGASHACAADRAGLLHCWGSGVGASNGFADQLPRTSPEAVPSIAGVVDVTGGGGFTCFVDATGPACFGSRAEGQLGDGSTSGFSASPIRLSTIGAATRIFSIFDGACAIDGATLYCWGDNEYGQLGRENTIAGISPRTVGGAAPFSMVSALSAGRGQVCAVSNSVPYCWGRGLEGQLGFGGNRSVSSPAIVVDLTAPTGIRAGYRSSCAVDSGVGYCWGENATQRLGTMGGSTNVPAMLDIAGTVGDAQTSLDHGCALVAGAVYCWGANASGQLGRGGTLPDSTIYDVPAPVVSLSDAIALAIGEGFSCARRIGGTVQCWGSGGKLGDGTGLGSTSPVTVSTLTSAIDLEAGRHHACAIEEGVTAGEGQVYCWGDNTLGAVGHPGLGSFAAPWAVPGIPDAVSVAAGNDYSCAVRSTGAVQCWGNNLYRQLGDGTAEQRLAPTTVPGIIDAFTVTAGGNDGFTTCVRHGASSANPVASCWGDCSLGACGGGEALVRPTPMPVLGL